jgi:hypothetical protein
VNTDWMPEAYEKANDGDWSQFTEHLDADHYTHQVPATGLHYTNRADAIDGLKQRYAETNMRQTVQSVAQHGDFVIANVQVTSNLYTQPTAVVHVFRVENDKFVELIASYPPPAAAPQH